MERADVTIVLIGPTAIAGPHPVPAEAAEEALACIDDDLALVEERVVRVDELWVEVLRTAAGPGVHAVIAVVPSWWSPRRCTRVRDAGQRADLDVTVRSRADVLCDNVSHVIEVAPDVVAVHPPDGETVLVPRVGEPRTVTDAVLGHVRGASAVLVDDPDDELGRLIAHRLRMQCVGVSVADDDMLREGCLDRARRGRFAMRVGPRTAVAVAAVLAVVLLSGAGLWHDGDDRDVSAWTWLVEGRVTLEVPAGWATERIVDGPGSARVQVMSSTGGIIHVTQSVIPVDQAMSAAAETVRAALAGQQEGVFSAFESSAEVAGVPAMTYRESRPGRYVEWTLVLDGDVRIAIGCQGSDVAAAPQGECEHAITTARKIR